MSAASLDQAAASAVSAPLDLLLTQAALGSGHPSLPLGTTASFARALVSRPRRVATRARGLTGELVRVAIGTSTVAPSRRDRRFTDPAWSENPLLRRLVQAYLATSQAVEGLTQDVPLDWRDAERVKFFVSNVVEALAPSNNPLTSPVAWKAAIDSGGLSAVRGVRNLLRDMSSSPRVPSMVDRDAFIVGEDLAASAGAVVLRTPLLELVQYAPTTDSVHAEPLLIVPPTINKGYVIDLAPGRSLVEHLVASGQQVFMIYWRNPDARHSKWGFDTYGQAILDAMTAVRQICSAERTHVMAVCSGGTLTALAASYLAHTGKLKQLASLTLLVTVLDQAGAGTMALIDERSAAAAIEASRRKGYLDGRQLAEVFTWLRPSDLIWNYVVNNYLQGKQPPGFDILAWNADTTRMTARLHADFIKLSMSNGLTRPGGVSALGHEVDLRKVTVDTYVLAGVSDHLCPWQSCFRSVQLFGGDARFVLSSNGHVAAIVNPPGGKSSYVSCDVPVVLTDTPEQWQAAATPEQGSWWTDYVAWLSARNDTQVPAPSELGDSEHCVLSAAPGSYVHDA